MANENNNLQDILKATLSKIPEGNFSQMANNLKLNEQNIDLNSVMGLASKLLSNEAVMNSLQGIGSENPLNTLPVANTQPKQEKKKDSVKKESMIQQQTALAELTALREQYTNLSNEFKALKSELMELQRTIQSFSVNNTPSDKKKKD